ncbi:Hypothetical protein Tpal_690 [Trichococcus palustris]|jgi:hypothetical protein|uniref:Uncharacterized protein n=1 Tax=Trichococcus palustris TaxID=140314 RepID=A0A143YD13_9LACT|nr:Hypothetical protein Tpal_690 [Trichococcus palustris]SFK57017.1 hypothetical protein SAMN04488076_101174 [Trichococcus palustris]
MNVLGKAGPNLIFAGNFRTFASLLPRNAPKPKSRETLTTTVFHGFKILYPLYNENSADTLACQRSFAIIF